MRSFWVRKRAPQGRKQGLDPHRAAGSPVLTSSTQETGLLERDRRDLGTAGAGRNHVPKLGKFKQKQRLHIHGSQCFPSGTNDMLTDAQEMCSTLRPLTFGKFLIQSDSSQRKGTP